MNLVNQIPSHLPGTFMHAYCYTDVIASSKLPESLTRTLELSFYMQLGATFYARQVAVRAQAILAARFGGLFKAYKARTRKDTTFGSSQQGPRSLCLAATSQTPGRSARVSCRLRCSLRKRAPASGSPGSQKVGSTLGWCR